MAEPVPALPISPEPDSSTMALPETPPLAVRKDPVPWPEAAMVAETSNSSAQDVMEQIYEDVRSAVAGSYRSTQRAISNSFNRGRRNAQYLMRERPLHVIAGVALASFLAGAALRVWRSHYE